MTAFQTDCGCSMMKELHGGSLMQLGDSWSWAFHHLHFLACETLLVRFSSAKCWDMVQNEAAEVRQYVMWVIDGGIDVCEGNLGEWWWMAQP
jgi:hypothetical protein